MKNLILILGLITITSAGFSTVAAQEPPLSISQGEQESPVLSDAELAQMLAPIALYPDSLLTHILIASTYPIEVVEAHRWLKKNDHLSANKLAKSVEKLEWDESVKALIAFERVLGRLSENLTWTLQLGDAFLQDEERLLDSIQTLRRQAKRAGNLDKMNNMEVSYEDDSIVIEPVEKEIVYVPYYDTRMVYGSWHWTSYPPVYWTPHHGVHVSYYHPFHWHSGIHISFNYFFSAFHWHNRHLVVVKPHRSRHYRTRHSISRGGYSKRWVHQANHRRGVAYRNKHVSNKYRSDRVRIHKANKHLHGGVKVKNTHNRVKQKLATKHNVAHKKSPVKVQTKNRVVKQQKSHKQYQQNKKQYSQQSKKQQSNKQRNKQYKTANKQHSKQYKTANKSHKSSNYKKQHQARVKHTAKHTTKHKAAKSHSRER